jgi:hypothetical protein
MASINYTPTSSSDIPPYNPSVDDTEDGEDADQWPEDMQGVVPDDSYNQRQYQEIFVWVDSLPLSEWENIQRPEVKLRSEGGNWVFFRDVESEHGSDHIMQDVYDESDYIIQEVDDNVDSVMRDTDEESASTIVGDDEHTPARARNRFVFADGIRNDIERPVVGRRTYGDLRLPRDNLVPEWDENNASSSDSISGHDFVFEDGAGAPFTFNTDYWFTAPTYPRLLSSPFHIPGCLYCHHYGCPNCTYEGCPTCTHDDSMSDDWTVQGGHDTPRESYESASDGDDGDDGATSDGNYGVTSGGYNEITCGRDHEMDWENDEMSDNDTQDSQDLNNIQRQYARGWAAQFPQQVEPLHDDVCWNYDTPLEDVEEYDGWCVE